MNLFETRKSRVRLAQCLLVLSWPAFWLCYWLFSSTGSFWDDFFLPGIVTPLIPLGFTALLFVIVYWIENGKAEEGEKMIDEDDEANWQDKVQSVLNDSHISVSRQYYPAGSITDEPVVIIVVRVPESTMVNLQSGEWTVEPYLDFDQSIYASCKDGPQ
jgi:hypothetical protein